MTTAELATRPSRPGAVDPAPVGETSGTASSAFAEGAEPLDLRIHAITYLADTIRGFELRSADGTPLPPFSAGSHVEIGLPGDLWRSYSLINPETEHDRYVIGVSRDPASRGGSAYLCETARVGDMLKVLPPHNTFPLAEEAPASVLLAGGIGITPILSMIGRLEALGRDWQLHYAARTRDNAAFLDILADHEAARPGRVHIHIDAEAGSFLDVAGIVGPLAKDTDLYCCGPAPMIAAFEAACDDRDPDRIHIEHFTGTNEKTTGAFTVVLARSKKEFTVPAGDTIMGVLMDAGLRVPHSCREGVCGTCETRVIEGIPDHKDNVLSKREKASNQQIMICCSGAKSDRLVLDL